MATTTQPPVDGLSPPAQQQQSQPFELNLQHGHKDLVQAVAFNTYGDRCATGSVDGKIRVFNRHKDGTWRICDTWTAHGGEVLELQWLPATVYPNVLASLGAEGWFRLWAEDPSAAPGRRFCAGRTSSGRPVFDTRSSRGGGSNNSPYRSFSMKHNDETKHTYLALLTTEGRLAVWETEQAEALNDYVRIDEFLVLPQRPARGEETSFCCAFDPNPEPCYAALRAGVPTDALGLAVAAMRVVRLYRSRDAVTASYGVDTARKEFYLAVEVAGHGGLVREVAWAPGNIRGYDMIATACQDGYARVFRVDTPVDGTDRTSWAESALVTPEKSLQLHRAAAKAAAAAAGTATAGTPLGSSSPSKDSDGTRTPPAPAPPPQSHHQHHPSSLSASLASKAAGSGSSVASSSTSRLRPAQQGQPGTAAHTVREISRLDNHRTPVWRVGFDDDGRVLGTTGDDGKLLCYRQTPDGAWAKSSEMIMMKTRMAAP
ncbi:nucleoporin seh1 [Cordyceps fumosorosea ARSEF 2679]|uniref:Nucleoporin seh1 n=1 Tax=Cordyceps fumosorosea (strain ARSEF 2679) TaxID=1081104 RepID=A0A162KFL6_CORFA|nr:nucleoporin seh1 [Cordyceps fumosorosea ARSEF 2679]OAA74208.1 nucleoporin seh1 [Cordyceps fumosorosea ARSEF 2679]